MNNLIILEIYYSIANPSTQTDPPSCDSHNAGHRHNTIYRQQCLSCQMTAKKFDKLTLIPNARANISPQSIEPPHLRCGETPTATNSSAIFLADITASPPLTSYQSEFISNLAKRCANLLVNGTAIIPVLVCRINKLKFPKYHIDVSV